MSVNHGTLIKTKLNTAKHGIDESYNIMLREKKKQDQKKHMVIPFIEHSKPWKTILKDLVLHIYVVKLYRKTGN